MLPLLCFIRFWVRFAHYWGGQNTNDERKVKKGKEAHTHMDTVKGFLAVVEELEEFPGGLQHLCASVHQLEQVRPRLIYACHQCINELINERKNKIN